MKFAKQISPRLNFQIRAHEKVLSKIILPLGSGLANPGLN